MNEEWKDVVGYEGKYKVSNCGNMWSCYHNKKMRMCLHLGYLSVVLYKNDVGRRKRISRLVYEAFVGLIPDKMQVDHIDRNRANNSVQNLRCVNSFENQFNRSARRTFKKGNRWGYATRIMGKLYQKSTFLTEDEAHIACEHIRALAKR